MGLGGVNKQDIKYIIYHPYKPRMQSKLVLLVLIFLVIVPLQCALTTYTTNPKRTKTVQELCSSFPDRTKMVSEQDSKEIQQYNEIMKASFSVTGNQLLQSFFQNQDPMALLNTYPNLPIEFGLFAGIFFVALPLLIISCCCSCCCCCCPDCCPPSSCCRHQKDKPYKKCQLVWPGLVLILALGLILSAGIFGALKAKDLQTTIDAVGCSIAIAFDDVINGNVTSAGKFFLGIRTLSNKISTIKSSLSPINTQLTSITPTGASIVASGAAAIAAMGAIQLVPANAANTKASPWSYETPFDGTTVTAPTLASKLPNDLGSNNAADIGTPIFTAYSTLALLQSSIQSSSSTSQTLQSTLTTTFAPALQTARDPIKQAAQTIQQIDKQYYSLISQISPNYPTINLAILGIYGGIAGLASIGILATLLMLICNIYKCRLLLYFVCVLLVWVGVVCFLLAGLVSVIIPVLYFGCDVLTFSVSSKQNFNGMGFFLFLANFGSFFTGDMANTASMVTVCLKGESGDFLQSVGIGAVSANLAQLRSVIDNINFFDSVAINQQIDNAWLPAFNLINDYSSGKVLDFNSPSDEAILQKVSNKNMYSCNSALFATDSWVPSTTAGSTVSCKVTTLGSGCSSANLRAGTGGCTGCLSTPQILQPFSTGINTQLSARYPDPTCTQFNQDLQSTYQNYYAYKLTNYAPILLRSNTANTAITTYKTSITNIGIAISAVKSSLESSISSIIDPKYGIVAGFNCGIIGEDLLLVVNTICAHGFKISFFVRLAFGIAGFGILVTACCASCTGVRHYKQSQIKSKARIEVKDITNETLEDIVPIQMKHIKNNKQSSKMNMSSYSKPPPNQKFY